MILKATKPVKQAEKDLGARHVDFDTLLAESDFVSVHTVLNDATRHLFNAAAFRKMKNSAIFINTARGPIHHEADLVEALRSGEIFAAGVDVTDPEPPDFESPLLRLPNCVVAPHIGSATVETRDAMGFRCLDNLDAYFAGREPPHRVA